MWLVSVRYWGEGSVFARFCVGENQVALGFSPCPAPSVSCPVGSLGNAVFGECTLAPTALSFVNALRVSEKRCSVAPSAAQAGATRASLGSMKAEDYSVEARGGGGLARPGRVAQRLLKASFPGEPVTETWKEAERGAQGLRWGGRGHCQCTGGAAVTGGLPSRGWLRGSALPVPA